MKIMPSDFWIFLAMATVLTVPAVLAVTDPEIVSRIAWHALPARGFEDIVRPVPYVVIHHTYVPKACNTSEECQSAMKWMQDFHMFNRSWWDIGYNFAVGGDGKVYEGRGWTRVGAHAPHYNNISMGITLIGDWSDTLPPEHQLAAVQNLVAMGVREGHIAEGYRLVGHKQVREGTTCPGDVLYDAIKEWSHFDDTPDYTNLKRSGEALKAEAPPSYQSNKLRKRSELLMKKLV